MTNIYNWFYLLG